MIRLVTSMNLTRLELNATSLGGEDDMSGMISVQLLHEGGCCFP